MKKKQKKNRVQKKGFLEQQNTPFILIVLFSLVLYGNTLKNDFALDDGIYITNHSSVQKGLAGIGEILAYGSTYAFQEQEGEQPYRPIPLLSFAIGKSLFDNNPVVEHFINLLLYALLGIFLYKLLGFWLPGIHPLLPLGIVGFFLAHPIHTEVVANIKSRDELLCFLFGAMSLYYLHQSLKQNGNKAIILSALFFGLSILSKENGLTLLGIVPLALYFFTKENFKSILVKMLPFIGVVGIYFLIRSLVITGTSDQSEAKIINNVLNAANGFGERSATTVALLGEYLRLLAFPYPLSWDYSYNQLPIVSWGSLKAIFSLLLHLGLIGLLIFTFNKKSIWAFCVLFYGLTFAITANILFLTGATLGERFLFMPSFAFCIAVPLLFAHLLKLDIKKFTGKQKKTWIGIMGFLLLASTFLTINRNKDWKNNLTLFEAGVEAAPNSARTHASLAFAYKVEAQSTTNQSLQASYFQKAEQAFNKSLEIFPDYGYALYNLGVMYLETGALEKAKTYFQKTIDADTNHQDGFNNLGVVFFNQQNYQQAMPYFEKAIAINPNHSRALTNLGASYHNLNNFEKAIPYYEKSIQLNPKNSNTIDNLIKIYTTLGNTAKVQEYEALRGTR